MINLKNDLKSTNIPVSYGPWPVGAVPPMPYICYDVAYTKNFMADGQVYHIIRHVQIDLYTRRKDLDAEVLLETALGNRAWNKSETYLDTERCLKITYECEV